MLTHPPNYINENNSAAKNISITAGKSNDVENRLSNILTLNQQAQDFLDKQRKNNITLNAIDSSVIVSDIQLKRPHAKKLKKTKALTSNKQDFEEVLKYIVQLERKIGITFKELSKCGEHSLKIFLLSHIKQLEYPQLKNKRRDAIRVLASDELRDLYDKSVQTGRLFSMPSYQECEELFQKLKNSAEALLSDNQGSTDDIEKKIDELIHHVSLLDKKVGDICKYKETVFDFHGKSQHSNPHKDVYQREVSRAQIKLDQHFNPIQELLKDVSQEAENFPEINELKKIINSLHKEHDVLQNKQQISGKIKASLICLVNRPLLKSIYDQKFLGEVQASTAEYSNVFEESSSASTTKLPLEIEFRNRSNIQNKINIQCDDDIGDKPDTKQKELEEDLKHMEKLKAITSSVYKIAEHNVAISNCKDFQNSYMKEKGEHPSRSSYCQKMIDIYQKNIQGYQAQIDHILYSVQEAFACISQTTRNLPDMKKFQAIINDVHKEHNVQQITKKVKSALCFLANVRNQIVSQNSGFLCS